MSDPNVPFKSYADEKSGKKIYLVIGLLFLVIIILAIFLFKGRPGEGKAASPKLKQMEEMVTQIQGLESEIQEKQNEVFALMSDYKKKTGNEISDINIMNLNPQQKQVLLDKIKNEKDISIKSLLQDILDKDTDIKGLNEKINELENLLPKPYMVDKGDNHYRIAMNFLLNEKGVEKKVAAELVERAALYEPLVPGFKVWNFFSDGEYGTFVTQGTAPISPNKMQRKVKKELEDARDQAIAGKEKLRGDIEQLEARRAELISQLDLLNQEKGNLITRMDELTSQNEEMQRRLNSVFYIADTSKKLQEAGILKAGFLRSTKLQSVPPENFSQSLDLRRENMIRISAASMSLEKIKSVSFYPKFYLEGTDYTMLIDEDKQNAVITLINEKKFRSERIVLAVN